MADSEEAEHKSIESSSLNGAEKQRLFDAGLFAGIFAFMLGAFAAGGRVALRFRAENLHRRPVTRRGWFLYHRAKSYKITAAAAISGARWALAAVTMTELYFGQELAMRHLLWNYDVNIPFYEVATNTVAAASTMTIFGLVARLNRHQFARTAR